MAQTLDVKIEIPETHILVKVEDYQRLLHEVSLGQAKDIEWLKVKTGIKSSDKLKERILYPFQKELQDFVHYPEGKGDSWRFKKNEMERWLDQNFKRIWG